MPPATAGRPPGPGAGPGGRVAVLIPVKAFRHAKRRLAPALDPPARAELARSMATHVVRTAAPLPVAVVCDDAAVARWASGLGAQVVWRPGRGLNGAVTDGVAALAAQGFTTAIVAHADLPHALDLTGLVDEEAGVVLVPDRREDGTNVIAVPTGAGFEFSYGPGSFARHRAEAGRLSLPWRVERRPRLAWDVDVPADLAVPDWSLVR